MMCRVVICWWVLVLGWGVVHLLVGFGCVMDLELFVWCGRFFFLCWVVLFFFLFFFGCF